MSDPKSIPKRLLIVTQKVNSEDQILGFFVAWIREFAKHFDLVTVICLEKGEVSDKSVSNMPANVRIFSLGKEENKSRIQYLRRFYSYIWSRRADYDVVLVHMNPIYVLMGGPIWKLLSKKIALWYTHKNVDLKLRMATFLVDRVFSASKESFRLKTKKLLVTGHGIDTDYFVPNQTYRQRPIELLTISRIAPAKHIDRIIDIERTIIFEKELTNSHLTIVGGPVTPADEAYVVELKKNIETEPHLKGRITFAGPVAHGKILPYLQNADIFLNLSTTGSLDKAVLEAMSCGCITLSSNEAFKDVLEPLRLFIEDDRHMSNMITEASAHREKNSHELRNYVVENHSLKVLIPRLVSELKSL